MKKLLPVALIIISVNTYAQKIRVGFTTGVSIANYKAKMGDESESGKAKAGFTAGVLLDLSIGKHLSFQPAVNFVQKGTKDEETVYNTTEKVTLTTNYIELPLNLLYNSRGRIGNFFIGAGPSIAVAISGKYKYSDGVNSINENIKFGTGDDDMMKPVDLGANFITGFSLNNGLMFSVNFNAGLNNLAAQSSDDVSLRSNYVGIKLGYLLNTKRK
ncbi:MAG TPA: porin family protein [Ferruginibacter sp.]|nr:porin family protein [Ferruginibacter sp.]